MTAAFFTERSYESARKTAWAHRKGRAYADARNEKAKAYQSTFVGKMAQRAGQMNTAAKQRGACGLISGGDLVELWARQNKIDLQSSVHCAKCGTMSVEWHADHIIPIKDGGRHAPDNLQLLCKHCHKVKTRKDRDAYPEQALLFDRPSGDTTCL
jgi:5-methylcytosine-specific restriction endonuclease McrA